MQSWTENELSLSKRDTKEQVLSSWIILKALSWRHFILLLFCLLWNILTRRQYSNWDSKYHLTRTLLFSKIKYLNILQSMVSFILALLQIFNIYPLNFKSLFIFTPKSFTIFDSHILSFQCLSIGFHVYFQRL